MAALLALCWTGVTATAASTLIQTDVSYHALELTSRSPVLTWESDGVRVFVVPGGGEVRQGPVRLVAPALVLWLDKNESRRSDVRAATVRVYAEGEEGAGPEPIPTLVRLVEGETVREGGVAYMRFQSKLAFAWNCPTEQLDAPRPLSLFLRAESAARAATVDYIGKELPEAAPEEWKEKVLRSLDALEVHFFQLDLETGQWTVVCVGDVRVPYGNVDISADAAVVWFDEATKSYEIYARGDCRIAKRPAADKPFTPPRELAERFEVLLADEVYVNPKKLRGKAAGAELRLRGLEEKGAAAQYVPTPEEREEEAQRVGDDFFEDVWVVRGREVYLLDSENLLIRQGSFTTSSFAHPNFQVTGERVRVVQDGLNTFVMIWGPRFVVGREERALPLLRPSFFALDIGRREGYVLTRLVVGSSSKFGMFARSEWRPSHLGLDAKLLDFLLGLPPECIKDWKVLLDYYGARGPAVGTELEYEHLTGTDVLHRGDVLAYYVRDSGKEDDTGNRVPRVNRGRLRLRHRVDWDSHWRTDAELYYLSDSGFLREYFEEEFENEKPPETYVFTRYRKDSLWAGGLYKLRINDFLSQVEETPTGELQLVAAPVGGGAVYDGSLKAGIYDLEVSNELALPDPSAFFRLHTDHRLSWPFNVGFVRVDPFLRVLGTVATRGLNPGGSFSGSVARLGAGGGVRASADFSRSYDVVSERLRINRLRHVMTPYVEFETLPVMTAGSEEFIPLWMLDTWPAGGRTARAGREVAEAIDKRTQLKVGMRQKLQTKRADDRGRWRSVDWMALDVALVTRSDDSVALATDDDYITADFDLRLTPNVTIYSHDDRISLGNGMDVLNLGADVRLSRTSGFDVSYHHVTDKTSSIAASVWTRLSDRYGLRVKERFELGSKENDAGNLETLVVLQRFFNKWLFEAGVQYQKSNDEFAIVINLVPAGLGAGASLVGFGAGE